MAQLAKSRGRKGGGRQRRDAGLAGFQRSDGVYIAAPRTSRAEAQSALARVIEMDRAGEFDG